MGRGAVSHEFTSGYPTLRLDEKHTLTLAHFPGESLASAWGCALSRKWTDVCAVLPVKRLLYVQ